MQIISGIIFNEGSHYIQSQAPIMQQRPKCSSVCIKMASRIFCFRVSLFLSLIEPSIMIGNQSILRLVNKLFEAKLFACELYSLVLIFRGFHDGLRVSQLTQLFHDRGRYHIETSPLICSSNQWTSFYMICSSNQWTSFYMITASIMKELKWCQTPQVVSQNSCILNQKYEKYQKNTGKGARLVIKVQAEGLKLY